MKKWMVLIFPLAAALILSGCAGKSGGAPEPVDDKWGIALSAKDVTETGMTLVIFQRGGEPTGQLEYGSVYHLEVLNGGAWEAVPYAAGESVTWTMEAYMVPGNDSVEQKLTWDTLYGSLPAGTYRLCKEFMDFRGSGDYDTELYYAGFELK